MAADEETIKRRYREFLELMPITIAIAGLPESQSPFNFSADQMETRVHTLAIAHRLAKQLAREVVTGGGS
jgi:hypothetical protein